MSDSMNKAIERGAAAIAAARSTVAFTGAGISVESGIPPFRGSGGLWESYDPSILDIDTFRSDPEGAWKAIKTLFYDHWVSCAPNAAHRTLAAWETSGRLSCTVTQNIDGLHGRAGCRRVVEYHGSLRELICIRCGDRTEAKEIDLSILPPRCADCGGVLKPDFVFFGEGIPPQAARDAADAISACDCLLIIGTSGEVHPASSLPPVAKRHGATIIELNPKPSTYTARLVDVFLPLGAATGMELLDAAIHKQAI